MAMALNSLTVSDAGKAGMEETDIYSRDWPAVPRYAAWTGPLSQLVALCLLVPVLPAIGVLVLLVRLTSRGPGIYSQERVGLRGKRFVMYKIRTMRVDAEQQSGAVWAATHDPRVTPVGRVLRALHLDELPQVFNMLRGEMALIGPRPERPEFVKILARHVPNYLDRLAVMPGVTGLAQINLPPDTDLDSVRRKLQLDLEYIHAASLWLDLRLALRTFLRIFNIKGDWPSQVLGLYRPMHLIVLETEKGPKGGSFEHPASARSLQELFAASKKGATAHGAAASAPDAETLHGMSETTPLPFVVPVTVARNGTTTSEDRVENGHAAKPVRRIAR